MEEIFLTSFCVIGGLLGANSISVLVTSESLLAAFVPNRFTANTDKSFETISDLNKAFSITVPKPWKRKFTTNGDKSTLFLTSVGEKKISIMIRSQEMIGANQKLEPLKRIEGMMNIDIENLKDQGNNFLKFGGTKRFEKTSPAYAITSVSKDKKTLVTSWGTAIRNRTFSIVALTDTSEGDTEVAKLLERVITSFKPFPHHKE